jgi:hypothetical protein
MLLESCEADGWVDISLQAITCCNLIDANDMLRMNKRHLTGRDYNSRLLRRHRVERNYE